jgi:TonB family protein
MVRWFRPEYRIEQALAGMEGSVVLDLVVDASGQPVQKTIAQRSGSAELDEAALRAAEFWRFASPSWKYGALEVRGRVEVRFNYFSFSFSRIDKPLPEPSADIGNPGNSGRNLAGRERTVRRAIEQLQAGEPDRVLAPPEAAVRERLAIAAADWGPATRLEYLGGVGQPRWQNYAIKPEYRSDPQVGSVAIQWDLYRAEHAHLSSLWKVAFDRRGEIWALKADVIPPSAAGETSTPGK